MLDVSDAFDSSTTAQVTHQRVTEGSYVDGYWVEGETIETTIQASVQPLSGLEFQNLPEGIRNEARASVLTEFDLKSGDRIIDGEDRYKVLSVDNWQKLGGYSQAVLGALE